MPAPILIEENKNEEEDSSAIDYDPTKDDSWPRDLEPSQDIIVPVPIELGHHGLGQHPNQQYHPDYGQWSGTFTPSTTSWDHHRNEILYHLAF